MRKQPLLNTASSGEMTLLIEEDAASNGLVGSDDGFVTVDLILVHINVFIF